MSTIPVVGSRWQRRPPGCEIVEVRRVWYGLGTFERADHWVVRAHPVRGGKPLIADAHWFTTEGFDPVDEQ